MAKRDYYEVLGLSKGASEAEIKRAYRRLARKLHPDVNPGNKAAQKRFQEVQEAYDVLKDAEKRGAYDRFGHAGPSIAEGFGSSSAGGFGGQGAGGGGFEGFQFEDHVVFEDLSHGARPAPGRLTLGDFGGDVL